MIVILFVGYLYRTPDVFDGIERTFLLHVRSDNTVSTEITHTIDDIVTVGTNHSLVHQVPEETTYTPRIRHHQLPIVLQSATVAAVVESVKELSRHEQFLLAHVFRRLTPRTVVFGLESVTVCPRIEHHAILRIPASELSIQFVIEATLVAITPEDDRRMVDIACHHLLHQLLSNDGFVCPMPSRKFIFDIKT